MKQFISAAAVSACPLAAQNAPSSKHTDHSSGGASAASRLVSSEVRPDRLFPVLHLRHGGGGNEENWSDTGRAGVILDNLSEWKVWRHALAEFAQKVFQEAH
jgi:hypothetical protein